MYASGILVSKSRSFLAILLTTEAEILDVLKMYFRFIMAFDVYLDTEELILNHIMSSQPEPHLSRGYLPASKIEDGLAILALKGSMSSDDWTFEQKRLL